MERRAGRRDRLVPLRPDAASNASSRCVSMRLPEGFESRSSTTTPATARPRCVRARVPRRQADRARRERRLQRGEQPRLSARRRAEYVLALNPDTRICEGTLDTLLALMDADQRVGICRLPARAGGRHLRPRGATVVSDARSALGHFPRVGRRERAPARSRPTGRPTSARARSTPSTARSCSCAARCSTRSACSTRATGCTWRTSTSATALREAGWITWYEPSVEAVHIKAGTSGHHRRLARSTTRSTTGCSATTAPTWRPQRSGPSTRSCTRGIALKFLASAAGLGSRARMAAARRAGTA